MVLLVFFFVVFFYCLVDFPVCEIVLGFRVFMFFRNVVG